MLDDKKHDSFFDEETPEDRKAEELAKMLDGHDRQIKSFSKGDRVSGKVTRVGPEYVFIDIGAKNEAVMKVTEFGGELPAPGDTAGGFIVSQSGGETVVSRSIGGGSADIGVLREAQGSRVPVQGKVTGVSKAGLAVKIMGHRAFCPVSQIDVKFTSDVNEYLGKTLDFVITRITEGGKNIVVSRVPLFEAGLEEQFKKFADAAGTGKTLRGKISKIVEFGLFVETGGLEGLVHISEVSWERAQKLDDTFSVGQEIEFVVLKAERKDSLRNSKISLSIKQALEDPWTKVADTVKVGELMDGKVTRLADFGAFVEILPGVEGLVHVSEMAWGRRVHHPSEIVKPGQAVRVTALGVDLGKRSVSLTLKDTSADPWNGIEEKLAVGADVTGTVARKSKFGYFIDLFEGVTGLLVFSRMAPDKKDSLKPGDTVTVQVESIETDSRRVALSMGGASDAASRKEADDTKEYLKKQGARQDKKTGGGPGGTEFGDALIAAMKRSKPGAARAPSAQKEKPVEKTSVKSDGGTTPAPKTVEMPAKADAVTAPTPKAVEAVSTKVDTEAPTREKKAVAVTPPTKTRAETTPDDN